MVRIRFELLKDFVARLLGATGLPAPDANLTASLLVESDLHGYSAHGVARVRTYLGRIEQGLLQVTEPPEIVAEGPAFARIDGKHYPGQVVAHRAMSLALDKAEDHGIAATTAFESGHMGRLADYVELAAQRGMIGMAMISTGSSGIPPHGGMSGVAGTNPIAYGIPRKGGQHFVLDFATAALSAGETNRRAAKGEPMPEGSLLDSEGNPTTDYRAVRGEGRSIMLAFGGYKGSGLNLVAELLAGVYSGHGLGKHWSQRGGPANNGGFFQAMRADLFRPLDEFLDEAEEFFTYVKSAKLRPGFDEILVPGERASRDAARQRADGLELEDAVWEQLVQSAGKLGVGDLPATR